MRFLSIQSHVAYGHVGNSAAVFPLQRMGHEVWPVLTVNFSNHTGYGAWGGPAIPAADVRAVVAGIADRGVLGTVDGVLSGYLGGEDIVDVVVDAVTRVKAENPAATFTCDPVMGNANSGCFVAPTIPPLIREKVVPHADIITPNQFELGYMTHTEPETLDATLESADRARDLGPRSVLVTSVLRPDREALEDGTDTIEMLAVDDAGAWIVQTPRLPIKANGSGDVTSALFTAHYRVTGSVATALERTASSVFDLLQLTIDSGERELRIVQAQDAFANPRMQFSARQVR
ncbi:pyridoxal kinase PdxY [Agrococcus sp. Ld7]|uniref:pyridoxal kinase PdxY n=1 Tax=Agrococcus sp. Ld7 TaxID=649148 RepID=UPI003865EB8B